MSGDEAVEAAGGPSLGERFAQELYDEFYCMGLREDESSDD